MAGLTMEQMQHALTVMQQSHTDLQTDNLNMRQIIDGLNLEISTLRDQCKQAHTTHGNRIEAFESSTPAAVGSAKEKGWNLENKGGQLKIFNGEEKAKFRTWVKKLKAFCNGKCQGFRKMLRQVEIRKKPIEYEDLINMEMEWQHTWSANAELYDLLVGITESEALSKVEGTPGEENGFEAFRRLTQYYDPLNQLNEVDRIAQMTCLKVKSMKHIAKAIEDFERRWTTHHEPGVSSSTTLSR